MVQGYIIFPSIISIIQRLANSVTIGGDGTVQIDFKLKGMETAQLFSIGISMVSLAWCFSEYNSVRKNMLLDITVSPCSRFIMCLYMLFQVIARLLAFMLFTLYWGPWQVLPTDDFCCHTHGHLFLNPHSLLRGLCLLEEGPVSEVLSQCNDEFFCYHLLP